MSAALELLVAAWPLLVVAALAALLIRGARGPRRHGVRGGGDYARDAARQEGRRPFGGRRHVDFDGGGADGGGGGD
ncbi:MAG: hypothetical protein GVY27_12275 [Deinococcus-Thermus bacterium]|nr:hypothetical protein [Deinococcota bacterium]